MGINNFSLDILRAISIIFILITHSPDYSEYQGVQIFSPYFAILGVGSFIFLSGYVNALSRSGKLNSPSDVGAYLKKRFIRVYPLYWIALVLFFVGFLLFDQSLSVLGIIVHFLGLQMLLAPLVHPVFTLYFVGLIVVYYLLFAIIMYRCDEPLLILIRAVIVLLPFAIAFYTFNVIDPMFFEYYFIFIGGILAFKLQVFKSPSANIFLTLCPTVLVFAIVARFNLSGSLAGLSGIPKYGIYYGLTVTVVISFCLTLLWMLESFGNNYNALTKKIVLLLSFSSYSIYLFHRPILTIITGFLQNLPINTVIYDLILIFIGFPLIVLVSYYMTIIDEQYLKRGINRLLRCPAVRSIPEREEGSTSRNNW